MSSFSFNVALALDRLCRITPPCLYGFGAAAVAAKMRLLPEGAGTGTLAAAAALVWAFAVAADMAAQLRRPFPREYADAWLDWKNRAGGRILARVHREPVRVTPGIALTPLLKSLAPPLAFVCAVLLLPAARAREKTAAESVLSRVAGAEERLAERGDALADPDRDRFARQLAALRELAAANPEAAAEALASFEQRLAGAEARRLERAAGALEAAADWRVGAREADARAGRVGGGTGRTGGGSEGGAEAADGHFREVMEEVFRSEGGLEAMPEAVQSAWRDAFGEAPSGDAAGEAREGAGSAAPGADGRRERLLAALREWSETLGEEAPSGAGGESAGGGGEENAGSAEVSLYEGSVGVYVEDSEEQGIAGAEHETVMTAGERFTVNTVTGEHSTGLIPATEMAKYGFMPLLKFDESNLGDLTKALEMNYGVEFNFAEGVDPVQGRYSGNFEGIPLDQTLEMLSKIDLTLVFKRIGDGRVDVTHK